MKLKTQRDRDLSQGGETQTLCFQRFCVCSIFISKDSNCHFSFGFLCINHKCSQVTFRAVDR